MRQLLPDVRPLDGRRDLEELYLPPTGVHLRVNFVTSLDGAVEIGGRSGPLGGPVDRDAFMAMRAVADAVMVGAGTARAEDYGPVRFDAGARARRVERGQPERAPLVVVTRRGMLSPDARMFEEPGGVIVLTTQATAARDDIVALGKVAEVLAFGDLEVDLAAAVAELHRRGLGRILCEGGPMLTGDLFVAGLVDELCLTLSPVVAGGEHRHLGQRWPASSGPLSLTGLVEGDGMLVARYSTRDRP